MIEWYLCNTSCVSSKVSLPQRSLRSQDHKCPPRQVAEWQDSLPAAVDARKAGGNLINELRAWVSQMRNKQG